MSVQAYLMSVQAYANVSAGICNVSAGICNVSAGISNVLRMPLARTTASRLGVASSSQMRWQCIYINALSKSVSLPLGAKAHFLKSSPYSGRVHKRY